MKKVMIWSGVFSAAVLTAGIILKYMHAPGSAVLVTLGIVAASLIFVPLLFAVKVKEKQAEKDKMLIGLGTLSGIAISLGILFKLQHWPGANILCVLSLAVMMLVFLPVYFFGGIRNPETKVNTMVTSIIIIVGCGLFFSMTMTPQTGRLVAVRSTRDFLRNEQILATERALADKVSPGVKSGQAELGSKIYALCEDLKSYVLVNCTGYPAIGADFEAKDALIRDYPANDLFMQNAAAKSKLEELRKYVALYNTGIRAGQHADRTLPAEANVIDAGNVSAAYRCINALNDLVQVQMFVLQNELAM